MKILMASYVFYPSLGGIEAVSAMLAEQFVRRGYPLQVATCTPAAGDDRFPYEVVRQPGPWKLLQLIRDADVVLHSNLSMRLGWPMGMSAKPWVVSHHTWIPHNLLGGMKRHSVMRARNIAVSRAVAAHVGVPSTVIPSPYDDELFYSTGAEERDRDLVFVGRLVSDKGVASCLQALYLLRQEGIRPEFTIIGSGPEEAPLRRLAADLGLASQVHFAGAKRGEELGTQLRRYRVLVVPSLYQEPFGIVALEGIASGCAVVGSAGGGLGEAIGPCGLTFPNGDVRALAERLAALFTGDEVFDRCRSQAAAHLARFTKARIAGAYLSVLESALRSSPEAPGRESGGAKPC